MICPDGTSDYLKKDDFDGLQVIVLPWRYKTKIIHRYFKFLFLNLQASKCS